MNHIGILKNLDCWGQKIALKIAPLKDGMNNRNFFVRAGRKKYVAHFAPETHNLFWLDREREIRNYKVTFPLKLSAKVFKYYPKFRLLIVEYLEGKVLTKRMAKDPKIVRKIAKALKKLHSGKPFPGKITQHDRALHYLRMVERKKGWIPQDIRKKIRDLKKTEARMSPLKKKFPCHLDLMLENIILAPDGKIKFLDWEYAANGDPRYDLAMLSVKGSFGGKLDDLLTKEYFGKSDSTLAEDIRLAKAVVCFAEASYGVFQNTFSKRKDIGYKAYAISEFKKFEKIIRNSQ